VSRGTERVVKMTAIYCRSEALKVLKERANGLRSRNQRNNNNECLR
jgi:hypothetical protein